MGSTKQSRREGAPPSGQAGRNGDSSGVSRLADLFDHFITCLCVYLFVCSLAALFLDKGTSIDLIPSFPFFLHFFRPSTGLSLELITPTSSFRAGKKVIYVVFNLAIPVCGHELVLFFPFHSKYLVLCAALCKVAF